MSKRRITYIKGTLPVIFLQEGKKIIAYTPALDLSTCGDSFDHARKRFEELIRIFFEETENLDEVLLECGWQKVSRPRRRWIPPHYIGTIQEEVQIPMRQ